MPSTPVTLSTNDTVHLKEKYTHKADKEFSRTLNEGVTYDPDPATGEIRPSRMPLENYDRAVEAALFCLVVRVVNASGVDVAFSQDWLDDLPRDDYRKLADAAAELRNAVDREKGKKNS